MKKDKNKFKIISLILACCFVLSFALALFPINKFVGNSASADWKDHSASQLSKKNGWYEISTAEELACFRKNIDKYCYSNIKLTNNINLWVSGKKEYYWSPIPYFYGTFDGCGYSIIGMKVTYGSFSLPSTKDDFWVYHCGGLFSYVGDKWKDNKAIGNAEVKNVIFKDCHITNNSSSLGEAIGIVAGVCYGEIINCIVESSCTITSNKLTARKDNTLTAYIGGIAGLLGVGSYKGNSETSEAKKKYAGKIEHCTSGVQFISNSLQLNYNSTGLKKCNRLYLGGVVGKAEGANVLIFLSYKTTNSSQTAFSDNNVAKTLRIGGVAGATTNGVTIDCCFNPETSTINAGGNNTEEAYVGGIVGGVWKSTVTNCYNQAKITATSKDGCKEMIDNSFNPIDKNSYNTEPYFYDGNASFTPTEIIVYSTFDTSLEFSSSASKVKYCRFLKTEGALSDFPKSEKQMSIQGTYTSDQKANFNNEIYLEGKLCFAGGIVGRITDDTEYTSTVKYCYNSGVIDIGKVDGKVTRINRVYRICYRFVELIGGGLLTARQHDVYCNLILETKYNVSFIPMNGIVGYRGYDITKDYCYDVSESSDGAEYNNREYDLKLTYTQNYYHQGEDLETSVKLEGWEAVWKDSIIASINTNEKASVGDIAVDVSGALTQEERKYTAHLEHDMWLLNNEYIHTGKHFSSISFYDNVDPFIKFSDRYTSKYYKHYDYWQQYVMGGSDYWADDFNMMVYSIYALPWFNIEWKTLDHVISPSNYSSFSYIVDENNEATITSFRYYGDLITSLTIPETVRYNGQDIPVTSIGCLESDFIVNYNGSLGNNNNGIETLILPDNLKHLLGVDIHGLKTIYIPKGLESIGKEAFVYCDNLEKVLINKKSKATLSEGLSIGSSAFKNCSKLTTVELLECPIVLWDNAFVDCSSLQQITLTEIEQIPTKAFSGCSSLTYVNISNTEKTLTKIGLEAFKNCTSLQQINFNEGLTEIKDYAFSGCNNLQLSCLPSSLPTIGKYAFEDCYKITISSIENILYLYNGGVFKNCKSIKTMKLSTGMTYIYPEMFSGCGALEKVILPANIKNIGENAFSDCLSLQEIDLSQIEGIYDYAFKNCTKLSEIKLSRNLERIGKMAFYNCASIRSFEQRINVKSIGEGAFGSCNNLEFVDISSIHDNMETIEPYAFANCEKLKEVRLPYSIMYIQSGAFANCESLEQFYMPPYVEEIGDYAFQGCVKLKTQLVQSVKSIGYWAFAGCLNLEITDIPELEYLGGSCFEGCISLSEINYYGSIESWENLGMHWQNAGLINCTVYIYDMTIHERIAEYRYLDNQTIEKIVYN